MLIIDKPVSIDNETLLERIVIVGNFLPLHSQRDPITGKWSFVWDEDSLLLQMKDGFSPKTEVTYVGSLKVDIDVCEQELVSQVLLQNYGCIPTFLHPELRDQFYYNFCKQHLWLLFHYMLPTSPDLGDHFSPSLYHAYVVANQKFAEKIMEAMNSDDDYIWIHDYHLMLLPTFLRKKRNKARIGFFLHSPFPSSEIYRVLPAREDILKALLNADLIGFQTFDYARHFLSCCSRILGLSYKSQRGYIGLEYLGRTVNIKILPVGIHMGRLKSVLGMPETANKFQDIKEKFKGKMLLLGVDDMDIFKGISLKLSAFEEVLSRNASLRGKIVLVQIANPPRSTGKDVMEERNEVISVTRRINLKFGSHDYEPVVLIDDPIPYHEKFAFYAAADCCIVNAVRDGMNLVPYEYVVCRQGTDAMNRNLGIEMRPRSSSALVVSEFVGCSPSLSGAIRVNPWNLECVGEAMLSGIYMSDHEQQLCQEKHYRYVSSHDVIYWVRSFDQDLRRACQDHNRQMYCGLGFGVTSRVIALSYDFQRLFKNSIISSYKGSHRRAIFLDYDGTIIPRSWIRKNPSEEVISILNSLCSDVNNTVFIVSGRDRCSLSKWFSMCHSLGIAAEHGYFVRWTKDSEWESDMAPKTSPWKDIAQPIMRLYTEATDGSYIEPKETALVWHHADADPDFGSCQSKELLDHLKSVLANEPVITTKGHYIVEVKPQGVGKGLVVEKVLSTLVTNGRSPDFVMCIGDDRSDEDMFESIESVASGPLFPETPVIYACTVGQKPSKAKYFVEDISEVISILEGFVAHMDAPFEKTLP